MFSVYFQAPTIILMRIDILDPQNAKQSETHFKIVELPDKNRVSMVRNITLLGLLYS